MGDEERDTLAGQHADIILELNGLKTVIATARGVFLATGLIGALLCWIASGALTKIDHLNEKSYNHETRISVIETEIHLRNNASFNE